MSHNILQPYNLCPGNAYLMCKNVQIVGLYRLWRIIHWWLMCAVCLSVSLHLSVPWCLSGGSNSSKYPGINEAMNDVLICHKFHLFCLANTFKRKTKIKTKKRSVVVTLSYVPPPWKGKTKTRILHISKINTMQRAVSRCLNIFVSDTLHSADTSALCWWRIFEFGLCFQCVQDCDTANT